MLNAEPFTSFLRNSLQANVSFSDSHVKIADAPGVEHDDSVSGWMRMVDITFKNDIHGIPVA